MNSTTFSPKPLAYRRIEKKEILELSGSIPRDGELKDKPFAHLLEKVPGKPEADYEYLIKRASQNASLRERKIDTTPAIRITAIEGKVVEVEVGLFDKENKLRAIAHWKRGEARGEISFTRVD